MTPTRRTLLLGSLGAVGLAACSGDDGSSPPSQTTSPIASSTRPSATQPSSTQPSATPSSSAPATSQSPQASPAPLKIGEPQELVTGLTTPWGVRPLDDQTLLVSERDTGKIKTISDGKATEVLTVADVQTSSEGGLLGLELTDDRLFVYVTTDAGNRVVAYQRNGTRPSSGFTNPTTVLDEIPAAGFHNGGQLAIGPDKHLYIATGDATERQLAQDKNSVAGKILRITQDGAIPKDNPFGNAVWSMGHRNVQGLAFADNGDLWSCEFGEKTADEINLITRGGNYGWPEVEGNQGQRSPFLAPKLTWEPTASSSPSALAFAHGHLWVGALMGRGVFQVPVEGQNLGEATKLLGDQYGRIRAVVPWRDGIVFGSSNTDGRTLPRAGDDRLLYLPLI